MVVLSKVVLVTAMVVVNVMAVTGHNEDNCDVTRIPIAVADDVTHK